MPPGTRSRRASTRSYISQFTPQSSQPVVDISDDEVEEIEGRPRDGRQHVYVWRQRGDHFIGHEELAESEEAARVERAAKRLVDEVKVSGVLSCRAIFCLVFCAFLYACFVGRYENGEVPETVL